MGSNLDKRGLTDASRAHHDNDHRRLHIQLAVRDRHMLFAVTSIKIALHYFMRAAVLGNAESLRRYEPEGAGRHWIVPQAANRAHTRMFFLPDCDCSAVPFFFFSAVSRLRAFGPACLAWCALCALSSILCV